MFPSFEEFQKLIAKTISGQEKKREAVCMVSDENKKLFQEIVSLRETIGRLIKEKESKRAFIWAKVEKETGLYGEDLSYDEKSGMIMKALPEPEEEKTNLSKGGSDDD